MENLLSPEAEPAEMQTGSEQSGALKPTPTPPGTWIACGPACAHPYPDLGPSYSDPAPYLALVLCAGVL